MAEGGRVGKFSQNLIGDQRLLLHVVFDERLEMSLQEIGCDCHLSLLGHSSCRGTCRRFIALTSEDAQRRRRVLDEGRSWLTYSAFSTSGLGGDWPRRTRN